MTLLAETKSLFNEFSIIPPEEIIFKVHKKAFKPLMHNVQKWSDTHFKNLEASAVRFLKSVTDHFWTLKD